MSRHSKNSTALAFFTNAERSKLNYGSQKQRVGRDSMKDYDACFLCLSKARTPVCCSKGHIACKECLLQNLLAQKKEISRLEKIFQRQQELLKEEESIKEAEKISKDIELFEKTQTSVTLNLKSDKSSHNVAQLNSFWVPSLTPESKPEFLKKVDKETICIASEEKHSLSIRKLIHINFTESKGSKDQNICPACLKAFTNGSKIKISKVCGHVLCAKCCKMFVAKSKECFVCNEKTKEKEWIDLVSEGTGFAGSGGKVEVVKEGVGFQ